MAKQPKKAEKKACPDPDFRPNGLEMFYSAQERANLSAEAIEAFMGPPKPSDVVVVYPPHLGARPVFPSGKEPTFVDKAPEDGDYLAVRSPGSDRRHPRWQAHMRPNRGRRGARWSTGARFADLGKAVGKCVEYAAELRSVRLNGLNPDSRPVAAVLAEFLVRQALRRKKNKLSAGRVSSSISHVAALQPLVEGLRAGDLDDDALDELMDRALAPKPEGLSLAPSTTVRIVKTLHQALRMVLSTRRSPYVPDFEIPRATSAPPQTFEPDAIDRLIGDLLAKPPCLSDLSFWDSPYPRVFLLGFIFGTRIGVMLRTTWRDLGGPWIDVDNGVCHRLGRAEEESRTKRNGACPIPVSWLPALRALRDHDQARGVDAVIHGVGLGPLTSFDYAGWYDMLEANGVEKLRPHALKHTLVDLMRLGGVPLESVAAYLSTTSDTLELVYGKWDLRIMDRAAAAVCDLAAYRARRTPPTAPASTVPANDDVDIAA